MIEKTDLVQLDALSATPPRRLLWPHVRRPVLLLVDDQPLHIQSLYRIFQEDCEVFMATSGEQALEQCRQHQPDLILLDVVMPGMDGLTMCRILKKDKSMADIPILFVTAHSGDDEETEALDAGAVDFISKPINPPVVRARVRTHLTLKAQSDILRAMAYVDGLTGLPNRRYFDEEFHNEWRRGQRNGLPLAVMIFDVDFFKLYNDHYGHQEGDLCLKAVARFLCAFPGRGHDRIARYGGEEFVYLLPECDADGARLKAEGIRSGIEALQIPHSESSVSHYVTVSIGFAASIPHANSSPEDLLAQADAALYQAKRAGRNRVMAASAGT